MSLFRAFIFKLSVKNKQKIINKESKLILLIIKLDKVKHCKKVKVFGKI